MMMRYKKLDAPPSAQFYTMQNIYLPDSISARML